MENGRALLYETAGISVFSGLQRAMEDGGIL